MDKSIINLRVSHGTVYNFVSHETQKMFLFRLF